MAREDEAENTVFQCLFISLSLSMSYRHNARSVNAKTVLLSCQTVLSVSPNGAFRVAKRAFLCRNTGFMMGRNSLSCNANDVVLCG